MPRRKKLPAIPDLELEGEDKHLEKMVVQKSNPLLSLSETGLTLAELKVIDCYLSKIDSHKPEKRYITIEKGELEKLLDVTQIKAPDLEKRIDNLFQVVTIRDKNKEDGFCKIALFEKAECHRDKSGSWQVELACTPSAMEYIFNVERLHYLRYALKDVIKLKSRYSYALYLYLENNRNMHLTWEIDINDLKTILRCTAETYETYKRFNNLVLSKCCEELSKKTSCRFEYRPVKKGRAVKAVRFTLEPRTQKIEEKEYESIPGQMKVYDYPELAPDADEGDTAGSEIMRLYAEAVEYEFNPEQIEHIASIMEGLSDDALGDEDEDIEIKRYHFIRQKYTYLKTRKNVKKRFEYLCKMLQEGQK